MNTPAHLLIGAAAFGRGKSGVIIAAALVGALLPDLSLYLMAGTALFIMRIPPDVVFDELYFSRTWQTVFAIDNSILLWGGLLVFAILRKSDWGIAMTLAALLHLLLDLPLHHDDGRPHFWPLSNWIFESPVSYWDPNHYGTIVGAVEVALSLLCCGILWQRFKGWLMRSLTFALGAMEFAPFVIWAIMF